MVSTSGSYGFSASSCLKPCSSIAGRLRHANAPCGRLRHETTIPRRPNQADFSPQGASMAEKLPETPADVAEQLMQHVRSLRGAGVEWVPAAELPVVQGAPA